MVTAGSVYTVPDGHILKGGDGWVIVAVGGSNQASDRPHLEPMLERIVANTG